MTVGPTSMDPEEAIYEAAEAPSIRATLKWPLVKVFLKKRGVEQGQLDTKSTEEWMDMLFTAIKEVDEVTVDAEEAEAKKLMRTEKKGKQREACSTESRRESDGDSGIQLERYQELTERPESVNFLVPDHEDYVDGKAALLCSYSEDDDKNYIAPPIFKRLTGREGVYGPVTLNFVVRDGGQSSYRKFIVQDRTINGEEFKTDIRFGMKVSEESALAKSISEEISNEAFDGGEDERDSDLQQLAVRPKTVRQSLQSQWLKDDKTKAFGYALGASFPGLSCEDSSTLESLGGKFGTYADAGINSFMR